jgi:hypothetical protein
MIARWKDLSEAYNARDEITSLDVNNIPKKTSFRASKWPRKFRTRKKLLKIVICAKTEKLKEAMVGIQVE